MKLSICWAIKIDTVKIPYLYRMRKLLLLGAILLVGVLSSCEKNQDDNEPNEWRDNHCEECNV